ncbi:MAG: iron-sulfur cluster insertion protein ErpA [Candidatus Krumholzibacteriia bacterium]
MITLTETAVGRIKEIIAETPDAQGKAMRLYVQGGGCAGFEYAFAFDDMRDDDTVTRHDGFELVVDPMSAVYLMGVNIDYVEDLSGAGFRFQNPNSTGACGCGKSFSV